MKGEAVVCVLRNFWVVSKKNYVLNQWVATSLLNLTTPNHVNNCYTKWVIEKENQ